MIKNTRATISGFELPHVARASVDRIATEFPASDFAPGITAQLTDCRNTIPVDLYVSADMEWRAASGSVFDGPSEVPYILFGGDGATYEQEGTTVTVTAAAHGIPASLYGSQIHLTIDTGDVVSGWFADFTLVDENTFTCENSVELGEEETGAGDLAANTAATELSYAGRYPVSIVGTGAEVAVKFAVLGTDSANDKTIAVELDGEAVHTPDILTTFDGWTVLESDTIHCMTPGFMYTSNTAEVELVDAEFVYSLQLENATEWVALRPLAVKIHYAGS